MGQIQTVEDLINLLIRRRLLIGALTVFGIVMTVLYVMAKPDVFESTAVIQVQSPTITTRDAPTGSEGSAQRLQVIQQKLTTRENMLAVIARHDLFAGTPLTDDQKVHLLRMAVHFETVDSAAATGFGQGAEVSAVLVSAQADTRAKAARVANDFAQGILDAGASGQIERTRESLTFFQEEQRRLKSQIEAREAEIAQFQAQNLNALPAQRDVLRMELTGLETELRSVDQALVGVRNERASIDRKPTLRATDRRQLDTLAASMETLAAQSAALGARRMEITSILAQAQDVDRVLAEYDRDLAQLQSQYAQVNSRSVDAETAAKLQDRQQSESFTLLERAAEPDYPISGGRRKLALVGALASLFFGIGVAFVLDHLRPVLRTSSQLERELDLRPIVAIPEVRKPGQRVLRDMPRDLTNSVPQTATTLDRPSSLSRTQILGGGLAVFLLIAAAAVLT